MVARVPGCAPGHRVPPLPVRVLRGALPRLGLERALPRGLRGAALAAVRRRPPRPAPGHPAVDAGDDDRSRRRWLDAHHRPRGDRPGPACGPVHRPPPGRARHRHGRLRRARRAHGGVAGGRARPVGTAGRDPRDDDRHGPARSVDRGPGGAAGRREHRGGRRRATGEPGLRLAGAGRVPGPVRRVQERRVADAQARGARRSGDFSDSGPGGDAGTDGRRPVDPRRPAGAGAPRRRLPRGVRPRARLAGGRRGPGVRAAGRARADRRHRARARRPRRPR